MDFREHEAIYLQIAGYVSEHILTGKWAEEEKIPSVRDLGVTLEVNPNTVMRAYELLQSQEVIYNKRGLGFFVSPDSRNKIRLLRKERFVQQELPEVFRNMALLEIGMRDIQKEFEKFIANNKASKK